MTYLLAVALGLSLLGLAINARRKNWAQFRRVLVYSFLLLGAILADNGFFPARFTSAIVIAICFTYFGLTLYELGFVPRTRPHNMIKQNSVRLRAIAAELNKAKEDR